MKVGLLISKQLPESGGAYTFEAQLLESLLKLLAESKHEFIIYIYNKEIPDYKSSMPVDIVSLYLSTFKKISIKTWLITEAILKKIRFPKDKFRIEGCRKKNLLNLLKKNQIDVVLSLTPNLCTVDHPYILSVWDLQHRLQPYFPEVSVSGVWEGREKSHELLKRASFIISGTEVGKAEIERFYQIPSERIKVIPFFTPKFTTNPSLVDQNIFTKYKIPKQYLFYPAQFWAHKNHIGLLLAIKYLKQKYDLELPLVLVGADKGNESYVREMVKECGLSKQVYFLGFVAISDMKALYQNAFALTFMTFFGPDNLPPLEAMSLGCPVIASNVSGAEEQLGNAALLVDPKQPEEIALAIKSLHSDSLLRQELIQRGWERARKWTSEDYIREVFTVIDDFEAIRRCWK